MSRERATAVSWRNRPMPLEHAVIPIDGVYTRAEVGLMSMGFIPRSPSDKWFIYMTDSWLSFHRSATGACVFRLLLEPDGESCRAVALVANRNPAQYRGADDAYDLQLMSHLIDRLLLGRFSPFPQPKSLSPEDQQRHRRLVMGGDDGTIDLGRFTNGSKP